MPRPDGAMPDLPARWAPVRQLGEGGQAEVWLAEDLELGEPVAVKVFSADLSPAARERLRREVRLGRALQHPGLVRVFEIFAWVPLAERVLGDALRAAGRAAEAAPHLARAHRLAPGAWFGTRKVPRPQVP